MCVCCFFYYFDRPKNNGPLFLICIKNVSSQVEHFFAGLVCRIGLSQVCGLPDGTWGAGCTVRGLGRLYPLGQLVGMEFQAELLGKGPKKRWNRK